MSTAFLLGISIGLQVAAAVLAILLIPATGRWRAWTCVALAIVLMSLRRCITLFRLISGDEVQVDDVAEWVALAISFLMLVGIIGIRFLFLEIGGTAARLRESEERVRMMLDQFPAVLWTTDTDLKCTASLGVGLRDLGIQPQDAVGTMVFDKFGTDDPAIAPLAKQRLAVAGQSVSFLAEWQGHVFQCHAQPFRDPNGNILGAIGVAHDVTEQKRVEEELQRVHEELELRVEARTSELRAANEQLLAEQKSLRRIYEMLEHERRLIAFEIHDGVIQYATGAQMYCDALCGTPEAEPLRPRLEKITSLLRKTVTEGRHMINGLRPPALDEYGIVAGITYLAEEQSAGLQVSFVHDGDVDRLTPVLENALYRIVQESVSNAKKYSQGTRVTINLKREDNRVFVDVRDDGIGFDPGSLPEGHYGVRGIYERARVLGGKASIESGPSSGTKVHVEFPILEEVV